ncbi:hypothetical protein GCM10010172_65700 [Paractinoplanes ferrugineus]|uniref:Methyltransferase domain-containing protein n=1 Tax=Paractinoplanes ferrugineus TaxID=113564 RepID=A0A919J626_9ACTN|nr:class I SAM-dependent methyltransferase [Actinoplanes ferrugineus]GIE13269.1 hypothetical protein Afe05nite_51090 [Actinoplanes ferrugineus]
MVRQQSGTDSETLVCELAGQFLKGGRLPSADCRRLTTATPAALYSDADFAALAVERQLEPGTDDGSRRPGARLREVELLPGNDRGRVLDLMCGVGNYLAAIVDAGQRYRSYLGIDVSTAALAVARSRYPAGPIRFVHADVSEDDTALEPCDTVLLTYEALNHVDFDAARRLLRRAAGALAPDGHILADLALADGLPASPFRTAAELPDGYRAGDPGPCVAVVEGVPTRAAPGVSIAYRVHHLAGDRCLFHFGYRQWYPTASTVARMVAAAGLVVSGEHRLHGPAGDEPDAAHRARHFVLAHR